MSTETADHTTSNDAHGDTAPDEYIEHGWPDSKYIQLAIALAIITALEVYASYAGWLGVLFIPTLIILMVIKFFAVVLFFMHLKFDSKVFSWMFYAGLGLAVGVYVGALLTFQFFGS